MPFARLKIVSILTRILQYFTQKVEWVFKKDKLEKMLQENGFEMTNAEKLRSYTFGAITGHAYAAIKRQDMPSR